MNSQSNNSSTMASTENDAVENDRTVASPSSPQTLANSSAFPSAHAPSLAGSVIEASDGLGGSTYIRIQNISSTGECVAYLPISVYVLLHLFVLNEVCSIVKIVKSYLFQLNHLLGKPIFGTLQRTLAFGWI